jgi:hypothetical protein
MKVFEQLELQLWQCLQTAQDKPELAKVGEIWFQMEEAIQEREIKSNGGHKAASTHCTPNAIGPIPLHSVCDWRLLQMDEAQTLGVFAEVDLLARHTSTSLGIYSRDSNEDHTVYLQHPNRSTKDEPALLRVPLVALPLQA